MARYGLWVMLLWCAAAPAVAQYPAKPVRLIVPFPPGGSTETLAVPTDILRKLAADAQQVLNTPDMRSRVESHGATGGEHAGAISWANPRRSRQMGARDQGFRGEGGLMVVLLGGVAA